MSFSNPVYIPLKNSTTQVDLTGTTAKTALASFVIKAGSMGANDMLVVEIKVDMTNNANNKTITLEFGTTNFLLVTFASQSGVSWLRYVQNRNSLSSQVSGRLAASNSDYGISTAALVTMSESTAVDKTVTVYGTLANSGDTMSLQFMLPFLLKAPQ